VVKKEKIQMSAPGTAPPSTRRELETALIEKCWKDPDFKKQVISDPKGMLEGHIGQKLPAPLKIFIHEEDAHTVHFSIPPAPSNLTELSDEELEKVAGGTEVVIATLASAAVFFWTVDAMVTVAATAQMSQDW
jgi:hypothetical protein